MNTQHEWLPKSLSIRILSRLGSGRYKSYIDGEEASALQPQIKLQPGEEILGLYRNGERARTSRIVVTNRAIHVEIGGEIYRIAYVDIVDATGSQSRALPPSFQQAPEAADSVVLTLRNGTMMPVVVEGRVGNSADVFEFLRFILRVIGK